jgi:ParB family chromosome partitioning protein
MRRAGPALPQASAAIATISVHLIEPAPWQPRKVFSGIERLADTIAGSSEHAAVGVLEPLLVRRLPAGKYELIDGERRWRACKLIASRRPDGDYLVPCRVFDVSEAIAPLLGQVANVERENPNPLETAYGYLTARDALRRDAPEMATARAMAPLSRHEKSQLNEYIAIAESVTKEFIELAGIMTVDDLPDYDAVGGLGVKALLRIAREGDEERRVDLLRLALGLPPRRAEAGQEKPSDDARPRTLAERVALHRDQGRQVGSLRRPAQRRTPEEARRLVQEELLPAAFAFAERACSGPGGTGFHMEVDEERFGLLLPGRAEALSAEQVTRLREYLTGLLARLPGPHRPRSTPRRAASRRQEAAAGPSEATKAPTDRPIVPEP